MKKAEAKMEKFDLKWNDFPSTVSQYFKCLREENDLYDVTLFSEDHKQFLTHKIVLTACSSFFKPILKTNVHSHPLIYLSGVDSTSLQLILDYIYEGQVQIYQEHLDIFLDVAQKLQVFGLLGEKTESNEIIEEKTIIDKDQKFHKEVNSFVESKKKVNPISVLGQNQEEIQQQIEGLLTKESDMHKCTVCGKLSKDIGNM